jgi:hypothetical protein
MRSIAIDVFKVLTFKEISIPALVALSVLLGMLAALVLPVTVR